MGSRSWIAYALVCVPTCLETSSRIPRCDSLRMTRRTPWNKRAALSYLHGSSPYLQSDASYAATSDFDLLWAERLL
ncbi:hypothetical protein BD310DRAFT_201719 [Dichomitus squalens]|uniref:Uncharacterized protein n=1 Tax=Dichomitus squalens TaxID=114155 RepID=A0A4Q9PH62_9APHY|nr:hypothetical protein BD310DRAFT_201719 [Dichomitus squalens]